MLIDELKFKFGTSVVNEAKYIEPSNIKLYDKSKYEDNLLIHTYQISDDFSREYLTSIVTKDKHIVNYNCECRFFKIRHICKHVIACIINKQEEILNNKENNESISLNILNNYIKKEQKNSVKEKMNLEIELDLMHDNSFKLKIGTKKLYVLNSYNKFVNFKNAYENGGKYKLGNNFEYDSNIHYFDDEDANLFDFFKEIDDNNDYYYYYSNNEIFSLSDREMKFLLDKLKERNFSIKGFGKVKGVKYDFPTEFKLDLDNDKYHLNIKDFDNIIPLNDSYKYIVYHNYLYILNQKYQSLLTDLYNYNIKELVFEKKEENLFKQGLLKDIKNDIEISDNIDSIVISTKPVGKLYFDFKRNKIDCIIKLKYNNKEINYYDNDDTILRDNDYESNIIIDLTKYHFNLDNKKIYLDDIDDIGEFISNGLNKLKDKYEIYTTKKLDNVNIINKSNIKSNFSIGMNGIMNYEFNTDNINIDELDDVFKALKDKKKYYKLKDGNIINLDEDTELQELNNIMDDLDIDYKKLQDDSIEIPKYRAFYIDSLKNNNYKTLSTDNSFNKFIENFNKYKDLNIDINSNILRDYQRDGVKWLYTLYKCDLGGILADEMGLGKSLQTIEFIKLILKEKKDAKILIVCPTSLIYNWKKEFDKFAPELKYVTVADNKEKRQQIINEQDKYNIFITSYGLIRNDNDEYEKMNFEVCVIDEAQSIKNHQALMTREIKKIKARTKIALTGTPLENSILELWSIFDFILPGYLNNIKKFKEKYGIKDVDDESLKKLDKLNYQIRPFILRRRKKDVIKDLPDKIENKIYLELPDKQKALYLKVLKESEKEINELISTEGFMKSRFKILQLLTKLRQICISPNLLYSNYNYESIKLEKIVEIINDYVKDGHKILIFSSFKKAIDKLSDILDENKISSYMINGSVKSKTRMELVEKFNSDDTNCFLITLKSGGTGLNLTSADVVIHLDIWWNPQVENQATDRAHRIGQKNTVSVIKLITKGTIEERIVELQEKKRILSDNLIEGKDNSESLSNLTEEDIMNLLECGDE